jgi:hypothetical protein
MFTDLSALFALIGAANGNRSVSVYVDEHHLPHHPGMQARAAFQRAHSIGWRDGSRAALRERPNRPEDTVKSGVTAAIGDRRIRAFQYSRLSETALLLSI